MINAVNNISASYLMSLRGTRSEARAEPDSSAVEPRPETMDRIMKQPYV